MEPVNCQIAYSLVKNAARSYIPPVNREIIANFLTDVSMEGYPAAWARNKSFVANTFHVAPEVLDKLVSRGAEKYRRIYVPKYSPG